MARYKERSPDNVMLPINLAEQLLPGTFEFALNDQAQARDRIDKAIQDIEKQKKRIEELLDTHEPRMHQSGREVKSNLTDNDSAKLKSSAGFIQRCRVLPLTDSKHKTAANAYPIGRQFEGDELHAFLQDSLHTAKKAGILKSQFRAATLPADTNYFSGASCRYLLQEQKMKALIADTNSRRRDPRFPTQKPTYSHKPRKFRKQDFLYDPLHDQYRCPNIKNNKRMNRSTLTGLPKVITQWLYYCLVHDLNRSPPPERSTD